MRINMKIIRNKYIPFKGFRAINLFGILFVRGNAKISEVTLNHEKIHTAQMKEMLYIFFYLWYVFEWIIRLFMKGNAYRLSLIHISEPTRLLSISYAVFCLKK